MTGQDSSLLCLWYTAFKRVYVSQCKLKTRCKYVLCVHVFPVFDASSHLGGESRDWQSRSSRNNYFHCVIPSHDYFLCFSSFLLLNYLHSLLFTISTASSCYTGKADTLSKKKRSYITTRYISLLNCCSYIMSLQFPLSKIKDLLLWYMSLL